MGDKRGCSSLLTRAVSQQQLLNANVAFYQGQQDSQAGQLIRPIATVKPVCCPKPRLPTQRWDHGNANNLNRMSSSGDVDDGIAELRQLLEVGWSQESPSITASLGVSPPVRSGAANPLHTLHAAQAAVACRSNLKALQELQSSQRSPVAACPGDYRLLIASPDFDGGVLTNDVAASSSRPSPPVILNRTQQKDRCSSSNASWSATQASPPEAGIFGY